MKSTSFAIKASLIASMIIAGQSFAQTLPDEINHTQYLQIYQNLSKVLEQKTLEFNNLSSQKAEIEKQISQMERDLIDIPNETRSLQSQIAQKQQEIQDLNNQIQGLESILSDIIQRLREMDNKIAQLQSELNEQSQQNQQLQMRRNQIAQDLSQINARLQQTINNENAIGQNLNRTNAELNENIQKRQSAQNDRIEADRTYNAYRSQLPLARNQLNQTSSALNSKKPALTDAQTKLASIKSEINSTEPQIAQIDAVISPKKTELVGLKAELVRRSPDIARLQNENASLQQKINANQAKIDASGIAALKAKRGQLAGDISNLDSTITANYGRIENLRDQMKPSIEKVNKLMDDMRAAMQAGNRAEAARIKREVDALNAVIAPMMREQKELADRNLVLTQQKTSKETELSNLDSSIASVVASNANLVNEITGFKSQIAENDKKINEQMQANSGLTQQITTLENEIKNLEAQKLPLSQKLANLRRDDQQQSALVVSLTSEIQKLEGDVQSLNARIAQMDRFMNGEYQQIVRRSEAFMRNIEPLIMQQQNQVANLQRDLNSTRQLRANIEGDRARMQGVLDQASRDVQSSDRVISDIRQNIGNETRNREALVTRNADSVRKLDNAKARKQQNEQEVTAANEQIRTNNQDLATINSQLPKLRSDLSMITPKVSAAENAKNQAQSNAENASTQYQNRLSLYQNYLAQAQSLGETNASIATNDGTKAGSKDALTQAARIGAENATLEAKWEALKRGYVRGEIAGYRNGFDVGMASAPDAQKGESDGLIAGARRAKDEANLVIKPARYLEELERRLQEDEVAGKSKPQMALMIRQEVSSLKAMAQTAATIPDLSNEELAESARIISSLDALIAQADVELKDVMELRKKLSQPRNIYSSPGAGENQNNANCSGVYKGVKEFVEACKGSYVIRYQRLYTAAHSDAFMKDYTSLFNDQVARVFEAELSRQYPGFYKEASSVGREVGISTGKKEIYQQSFARAELASYRNNLPSETARVEDEAVNLVQEHLNQNSAVTLKGKAKLATADQFGVSPGADVDLRMLVKNIGAKDSIGSSLVRITEISSNISSDRKEAPLASVAAKSEADLSVFKLRVSEAALPDTNVVIAGEIVHPGNHYRSNRVETFRIEKTLSVNASIDSSLDMDDTPKVANLFGGIKKHDIDLVIKPKFAGVNQGYEVSLTEIGSDYVEIVERPAVTEILSRGSSKKLRITYRLPKSSRGKTISLKLVVKNGDKVVLDQDLQIKPN